MRIDKCICMNRSFASLLAEARADKLTLEELVRRSGCGAQCGTCLAYMKKMLETGKTSFTEIIPFDQSSGAGTLKPPPPQKKR
jgi:bacterioferritin-associated ferredoxin